MPPTGYMVYLLIDPRDQLPFYVGMTCRPSARWNAHKSAKGSASYSRLSELRRLGIKCRVRVLATNLLWRDAQDRERKLIAEHKATLVNKLLYGAGQS